MGPRHEGNPLVSCEEISTWSRQDLPWVESTQVPQ